MEICNMSQIVCVRICLWVLIQCLEMIPLYKPCQFMYCGQRNGYNIIFFMQSCSSYFMAARMLWVKPINNHLQLWLYEPCIKKKQHTHTHTWGTMWFLHGRESRQQQWLWWREEAVHVSAHNGGTLSTVIRFSTSHICIQIQKLQMAIELFLNQYVICWLAVTPVPSPPPSSSQTPRPYTS